MAVAWHVRGVSQDTTVDPRWGRPHPLHDPVVLSRFRARPTDVLITTAPKAGTTWMQQILFQLREGGTEDFGTIHEVVPWLEYRPAGVGVDELLDRYEHLPAPRIFKTHCTFEQTPGVDRVKIVLSSRDPRDCCVSFYHHMMDMTDEALERVRMQRPQDFDSYFEQWMRIGSWYRNVVSWWPHRSDPNVLWLRYADMKADLTGCMRQITAHLGWSRTGEQLERAAELSSFRWMKANSERFTRQRTDAAPSFKPGGFIRRGEVGGHTELIRPEHEQRIRERCRADLPGDCLEFLGLA